MKPLIDPINTTDGLFHGKNKETGELATIVTADYMNDDQGATRSLQQEVIAVLTAAGIKPAEATNDQLLTALKDLFLAEDDSRVSGALQKAKNLSDVADASTTLANIGGVPTTRKINSKALSADITLSAGDVNAFPAEGGTVGGKGVISPSGFSAIGAAMNAAIQGMHLEWNADRAGEGGIVIHRGTGSGGLHIRGVNADNSANEWVVTIDGSGNLNVETGQVKEAGVRVYSKNYPPSQLSGSGWFKDVSTGFIIQWGGATSSGTALESHGFNIAFPNTCVAVVANMGTEADSGRTVYTATVNTTGFNYKVSGPLLGFTWIAIGY